MKANQFFRKIPYVLKRFKLVDSIRPDFVFCMLRIPPGHYTRIFYNNENIRPDIKCEWSFGTDYEEDIKCQNYMRHPNYARNGAGLDLIKPDNYMDQVISAKSKFCAFVYSHRVPIRDEFFGVLSKYKRVDSPGMCCTNAKPIGKYSSAHHSRFRSADFFGEKLNYLKEFKFAIIFENSSYPGYISEKIYHAMLAGCIPIYWGNPLISMDFNPKSFISSYDKKHKSTKSMFEYLVSRVEHIDNDETAYKQMLSEPWYHNNKINKYVNPNNLINRLSLIFRGK